jgi:hypothetical protein
MLEDQIELFMLCLSLSEIAKVTLLEIAHNLLNEHQAANDSGVHQEYKNS